MVLPLTGTAPGRAVATFEAPAMGLYRFTDGELERVFALGPAAPREFENAVATGALLAEVVAPTNGGVLRLGDGLPDVRQVREGRPAAGRGWIGITPRGAYRTLELRLSSPVPDWLVLLLAAALMLGAWLADGQPSRPRIRMRREFEANSRRQAT
jgi:hypothetical protein